ncbi:MAG: hypothetical protein WC135_07765 [Bacteroidales bacterium]
MLVDKMTRADIRKELISDFFESISDKTTGLDSKYRRYFIKNKNKDTILGLHYYTSKRLNKWLILPFARKNALCYGYVCIRGSSYGETCYAIGNNGIGITDNTPTNTVIHEFTPHLFDRYKARYCKDYDGKIIEHFFINNYFGSMYSNKEKGENYAFLMNPSGFALGYYDLDRLYFKYNTFITNEMLKQNQFSEHPDLDKQKIALEKIFELYCIKNKK